MSVYASVTVFVSVCRSLSVSWLCFLCLSLFNCLSLSFVCLSLFWVSSFAFLSVCLSLYISVNLSKPIYHPLTYNVFVFFTDVRLYIREKERPEREQKRVALLFYNVMYIVLWRYFFFCVCLFIFYLLTFSNASMSILYVSICLFIGPSILLCVISGTVL